MRLRLRQAHPKNLREALQSALELEAFQLASQHRAKPVRGATLEGEEQQPDSPPRMAISREDLTECMQQCMQTVCDNLQKKKTEERVNNPALVGGRGGELSVATVGRVGSRGICRSIALNPRESKLSYPPRKLRSIRETRTSQA